MTWALKDRPLYRLHLGYTVSGVGGGRDIDLRRFPEEGITLVGRMREISTGKITFADDLEQSLTLGEAWFADLRIQMDEYARAQSLDLPEEPSPKPPSHRAGMSRPIAELDVAAAGIAAVVWASGFRYNFDWVKLPVLGTSGEPLQRRGVSPCPGFRLPRSQADVQLAVQSLRGGG